METPSFNFTIDEQAENSRLDKYLANELKSEYISRERIKKAILEGYVTINGEVNKLGRYALKEGDIIELTLPAKQKSQLDPKEIPLDIVYEDDDLLVINKQVGLTVHPGAGNNQDTLVNALLARNQTLSQLGGDDRPGIVHRLDRNTSGLMLVAKNDRAHLHLSQQLQERSLKRKYYALVWGMLKPDCGTIETNIARSSRNRKLMEVAINRGKKAITHYDTIEIFQHGALSLIECELETGRTHQIRVHMSNLGHSIFGDPEYGNNLRKLKRFFKEDEHQLIYNFKRQALQAYHIQFIHPATDKLMKFEVGLADDFAEIIEYLR